MRYFVVDTCCSVYGRVPAKVDFQEQSQYFTRSICGPSMDMLRGTLSHLTLCYVAVKRTAAIGRRKDEEGW